MPQVWVPKEWQAGEARVAATPETVKRMVGAGLQVRIERGAGEAASFADEAYQQAGAEVMAGSADAWQQADVVLKVAPLGRHATLGQHEADLLKSGAVVLGFLAPYNDQETVTRLAARGVSSFPVELVPRISRAQSMDALSSQASVAGYKAVILAAAALPKYFPLMMTAAGTIQPARVVVMGAGVAGLQAVATAKRLGAVVEVSDIRAEVKEQVESLGGRFIDLPVQQSGQDSGGYAKEVSEDFLQKQRAIVRERVVAADVVITTALVPGKPAPKLVPQDMVEAMRPGSVIVDLAVAQGGNCELSQVGQEVVKHGVRIIGHPNLPATVPYDASQLYARNLWALIGLLYKDGAVTVDLQDDVVRGTLLTHQGKVVHERFFSQSQGGSA